MCGGFIHILTGLKAILALLMNSNLVDVFPSLLGFTNNNIFPSNRELIYLCDKESYETQPAGHTTL